MKAKFMMMMAAAATVLAACSNDDESDNWAGEIRLSSGLTVQQTRATESTPPDTQIANGQEVGIFINDATTSAEIYPNLKYTADGTGALKLGSEESTPFYPANGNAVAIYAYQPWSTIGTDGTFEFSVKTNQKDDNGDYYDSDLLYSESSNYARQKAPHSLSFTHKLSKVVCKLETGVGNPSLAGATVEIMAAETKGTFKPSDGTFTLASGNTSTVKMNDNITSGYYIAVIPPQTFTKGTNFLKITIGTGIFYYSIPMTGDDLALAEGNVYTYTITVNLTGVTVTSDINKWDDIEANHKTGDAGMSDATN